jgi:hypothetical protein
MIFPRITSLRQGFGWQARMNANKTSLIGSESATISEIRGEFRAQSISASDFAGGRGGSGGGFTTNGHESTRMKSLEPGTRNPKLVFWPTKHTKTG